MKRTTRLKKYVELFKRNMSQFLAPGISIKTTIFPVEADGAVFEFLLNKDGDSSETIEKIRPTINRILSEIPQRMIGGNIEGVKFGGTNLYLEGNRVLVIKGEDDSDNWSGNAVLDDVKRVVSTSQGSRVP
jgi:hypothetical protein